jgi:hypothetical protein
LHDQLLVHQTLLDDASLVEHVVASQLDLGQHLWDLSTQDPRREYFFSRVRTAGHVAILITRSIHVQGQPIPARTLRPIICACSRFQHRDGVRSSRSNAVSPCRRTSRRPSRSEPGPHQFGTFQVGRMSGGRRRTYPHETNRLRRLHRYMR